MASMSSGELEVEDAEISKIRSLRTDLGMTTTPRWVSQRTRLFFA